LNIPEKCECSFLAFPFSLSLTIPRLLNKKRYIMKRIISSRIINETHSITIRDSPAVIAFKAFMNEVEGKINVLLNIASIVLLCEIKFIDRISYFDKISPTANIKIIPKKIIFNFKKINLLIFIIKLRIETMSISVEKNNSIIKIERRICHRPLTCIKYSIIINRG
jgi:hypothetical protein